MFLYEIIKNYFSQFSQAINQGNAYYIVNLIPGIKILGLADRIYLYLIIFLGLGLILIFAAVRLIRHRRKINFTKSFLYFLLVFWLITLFGWWVIQIQWLKNDLTDFRKKTLTERRSLLTARIIAKEGLPKEWQDFYDFLESAQQEIPKDAAIYIIPRDNTFLLWANYWLYPDLHLVESSKSADYVLLFNFELLDEAKSNLVKFKEFAPYKLIFKTI